jgi:MFS family permease
MREVLGMTRLPRLRAVMVFVFASFAAVLGVRGLWGGPWLMEVKGLDRIAAGNILLACTVALTIGPALAGWVLRRFGHGAMLLAGSHLLSALLILLLVSGGPGGLASRAFGVAMLPPSWDVALLVLFGLLISFQIIAFSLVREAVPPAQAGRALSAANLFYFLGAAVLQMVSGAMASVGGVSAALASFAAGLAICTTGFLLLLPRRG